MIIELHAADLSLEIGAGPGGLPEDEFGSGIICDCRSGGKRLVEDAVDIKLEGAGIACNGDMGPRVGRNDSR